MMMGRPPPVPLAPALVGAVQLLAPSAESCLRVSLSRAHASPKKCWVGSTRVGSPKAISSCDATQGEGLSA